MITSHRKTFPLIFYSTSLFSLPLTYCPLLLFVWIVPMWCWIHNFLGSGMLPLCSSINSNKGCKTVLGFFSSHVLLMQWLPLCLEQDFACAGKNCPFMKLNWSPCRQYSSMETFQCSPALAEELHPLTCCRVLCMSGGQGQGWLSLDIIWVIFCVLFLSRLGSCHCLAGTESCFLYP